MGFVFFGLMRDGWNSSVGRVFVATVKRNDLGRYEYENCGVGRRESTFIYKFGQRSVSQTWQVCDSPLNKQTMQPGRYMALRGN